MTRCPTCRRDVDRSKARSFPFCTPRCRDLDLGRWLNEEYRIPDDQSAPPAPSPDDDR